MSYVYEEMKPKIFTMEGQRALAKIRERAKIMINTAGVAKLENILNVPAIGMTWETMACLDFLVELGELREVKKEYTSGQDRMFTLG